MTLASIFTSNNPEYIINFFVLGASKKIHEVVERSSKVSEMVKVAAGMVWPARPFYLRLVYIARYRDMEAPPVKKCKLEDQFKKSEVSTEGTADSLSVRQQLQDLISEVSAKCCGTPLPTEIAVKITDYCLYSDFSELPADAFKHGGYQVLSDLQDMEMGDMVQLTAIKNLPGKPLSAWGSEIDDIMENAELGIWWAHVGFPVGWKGSGELLEFDLWMCCELHHWYGVFVFEEGSSDVLLRYEPTEFCKPVRYPNRAELLSDLCSDILMRPICISSSSSSSDSDQLV